jgi:hypothetical protein
VPKDVLLPLHSETVRSYSAATGLSFLKRETNVDWLFDLLGTFRMASCSGSDRSARRPTRRLFFFLLSFCLASTFTIPFDSTTGARQLRTNHFLSRSHIPRFPLFMYLFSLFFVLQATTIDSQPQQRGTSMPQNFPHTFPFIFR